MGHAELHGDRKSPFCPAATGSGGVWAPLVGNVDLSARVAAIRPSLTTKGMYLADLKKGSKIAKSKRGNTLQAPPRHEKYQPFLDYPFADALRWLHAVARHRYPGTPLLEGLRQLGRDTVKVFLASHAGQVVRSMNLGAHEALLRMPAMWKVTDPSADVVATENGPNEVHFDVHGFLADRLRLDWHARTSRAQPRGRTGNRSRVAQPRSRTIHQCASSPRPEPRAGAAQPNSRVLMVTRKRAAPPAFGVALRHARCGHSPAGLRRHSRYCSCGVQH